MLQHFSVVQAPPFPRAQTVKQPLGGGAGTIDEKIYQRQLMKGQIADMMEGQGGAKGKKAGAGSLFSVEELKELFKLRLDTPSDTHDLLCKGSAATSMSYAHGMQAFSRARSVVQGLPQCVPTKHFGRMNSC